MTFQTFSQRKFAGIAIGRPLARSVAVLLVTLLSAGSAAAVCPTDTGVEDVRVAFIDLDNNGVADINSKDKERNERARISSSLATKLGVTLAPGATFFPQIRIINQNLPLSNGQQGTGIFSIFEIFTSSTDEIQVWADDGSSDEDSGEYRLFEDETVADLSLVRVTAYTEAPSTTTVTVDGGLPTVSEHFCEPHADSTLTEVVSIETDKRFALLTPHGGEIEFDTSEQIDPIATTLANDWGVDANTWDARGFWFDNDHESEHWHITSKEVSHQGFPGLDQLLDDPDFDGQRDFQYVASLHGMRYDSEGILIGGRADREAKCLIASRVRERMQAEGLAVPAAYIWNYDKDLAESIEVPHGDPLKDTITEERGNNPGLSGTDENNIVNRYSPNAQGDIGFGGFQIEQSPDLRDDTPLAQFQPATVSYRDLVAIEIANAFGELLTKPAMIAPGSTAICDALEAGDAAPTAEIRGRVWRDSDGNDAQGVSEAGVAGMTVDLLDAVAGVVATTTTDSAGSYVFPGLAAGSYRVRVAPSNVFALAAKDQAAGDDTRDSDVDPVTTTTDLITLAAHALVEHVDAGIALVAGSGQIGDFAWFDAVDNDQQDVAEDGLEGVVVELLDSDAVTIATTTTDSGGFYAFDQLPPGTFVLRFAPLPGYQPVAKAQGGDSSRDSDIDADFEAEVVLAAGVTDLTIDAGFELDCFDATLVAFGSEWSWSTVFANDWQEEDFVETSDWQEEKQGSLGYGLAVESSITDGGSVAYFRLAFEVEDPTLFDALDLSLLRNDGAVVYLNGTEVLRSNVPLVSSGTQTVSGTVAQPGLLTGTNVLAVEVHETDQTLVFDLEMTAQICRPCVAQKTLTDSRVTYLRSNKSDARGGESTAKIDASTEENALFGWSVDGLPNDAEVLHAAISWRVTDESDDTFHLFPLLVDWNEAQAQWFIAKAGDGGAWNTAGANHPDLDYNEDEPLASIRFTDEAPFPNPPYTGLIVLNVSGRELVQAWARGEHGNHGILVPGEGSGDKLKVDSDNGTQPPVLDVIYRSCSP